VYDVRCLQYPRFETRGDLARCVARFKEWLQEKVIDIEVAHGTPSPTVDPSVQVVLCGHSMGGVVAAETLLSIASDEVVPAFHQKCDAGPDAANMEGLGEQGGNDGNTGTLPSAQLPRPSSPAPSSLLFPRVCGILAFDTPYLGISPGVLAHGAEEQLNQATSAYKAFDTASSIFGWNSAKDGAAATNNTAGQAVGWSKWGKYAMYGAAAAGALGAAGAAFANRNRITEGFNWASSHLEFVGCLLRSSELQKRVEDVVALKRSHGIEFANFYTLLDENKIAASQYAGMILGKRDRAFCVVPVEDRSETAAGDQKGGKRDPTASSTGAASRRRANETASIGREAPSTTAPEPGPSEDELRQQGERMEAFAQDTSQGKGQWVACVNGKVTDEVAAHTSMFEPARNSDYGDMLTRATQMVSTWAGGWDE